MFTGCGVFLIKLKVLNNHQLLFFQYPSEFSQHICSGHQPNADCKDLPSMV